MAFKEDLIVRRVKDTETERNGENYIAHERTLTLENDLTTITIKGDPKFIPRLNTGEKIQVMLFNPQTQLISDEDEELLSTDAHPSVLSEEGTMKKRFQLREEARDEQRI